MDAPIVDGRSLAFCMTHRKFNAHPAMTAIAAAIALSSAPLFAQSIEAPNLTAPAPAADTTAPVAADPLAPDVATETPAADTPAAADPLAAGADAAGTDAAGDEALGDGLAAVLQAETIRIALIAVATSRKRDSTGGSSSCDPCHRPVC